MKKALLTKRYQSEANRPRNSSEVECSPAILLVLNGVLFQYLELQCLDQTYRTLYDECRAIGLPVPPEIPSEIVSFPDSDFEVQKLFTSFDNEDGKSLLEQWTSVLQLLGDDNLQELKKLGVLLRIYVALIPHRKNFSVEQKNEAMKALKTFFEVNSGDSSNDEEMLSYFALPYIPDIRRHPVLSKLLKDDWVKQVRARLELAVSTLYTKKDSLHPLQSDLARLYFLWAKGKNHLMNDADGNSWTFRCVSTTENCPPNIPTECEDTGAKNDKSSSVEQFFETIVKISNRNRRLLKSHRELQAKYSETTDLCCVLLDALNKSCSGMEIDMLELKKAFERLPNLCRRLNESHKNSEDGIWEDMESPRESNEFVDDVEGYIETYSNASPIPPVSPVPDTTKRKPSYRQNDKDSTSLKQIPSEKSTQTQTSESATVIYTTEVQSISKSTPNTGRANQAKTLNVDDSGDSEIASDTPCDEMYFEGINMKTYRADASGRTQARAHGDNFSGVNVFTSTRSPENNLRDSRKIHYRKNRGAQVQSCSARDPKTQ